MDSEALETKRDFSERLHGVDVKDGVCFLDDRGDFFQWPDDAGFVVRPEERDEGGLRANRGGEFLEVEMPGGIHRQAGNLVTGALEMVANAKDRAVLDGAGDDVAFRGIEGEGGMERGGDRLGAAAGENPLVRLASREGGDLVSCRVDGRSRVASEAVSAGGISKSEAKPRLHRLENLRGHRGRRVVVQIDCSRAHFEGESK